MADPNDMRHANMYCSSLRSIGEPEGTTRGDYKPVGENEDHQRSRIDIIIR